ncbi:hypothetical protein LA080_008001 [Diaporthe eres]|uniref:Uncharacterized protein n=1 Tax=Diaporthe vaccinii TaxID=105482 RepID=A0ABR4E3B6_9PEZI|nr:hypothetical protein LA080_008001 [Diaporthe eres]
MSTTKKWDDTSQKDLVFAMLMSTGDGNIKADWQKVEKIMISWGYNFTIGAMSQHWSKTILKAFKERHPDNAKDGDNTNPATPVKVGAGPRAPKTPASTKGNGKGRKRPASDAETSPEGSGMKKTLRTSAKKMKYSEDTGEDDDEEQAVVKGETVDEDYDHAI